MNRFNRECLSFLCVVFALSAAGSTAVAQTQPEKLRVAYTVIGPTQASVWTAKS